MMKFKTLLAKYGPLFAVVWVGAFIVLVTLVQKGADLPTYWGDILIQKVGLTIYLPFTSSAAFAAFVVCLFEMYNFIKRL